MTRSLTTPDISTAMRSPYASERQFQQQVTELAELRGWEWVHFRPAQTAKGWRTPVSGPLGKGWVDLVLVRERDRRLIFAEVKTDRGRLSADQQRVVDLMTKLRETVAYTEAGGIQVRMGQRIEVYVWHPSDFDEIEQALR